MGVANTAGTAMLCCWRLCVAPACCPFACKHTPVAHCLRPCRSTLPTPTGVYASQTLEAAPFALADVLTVALYRLAAAFGPGLPKVSRSVWLPFCTLRFHSASLLPLLLAFAWASCDGRFCCPPSGAAGAS